MDSYLTNSGSKVLECTCTNPFMDNLYGENMRLHTTGQSEWRCCSCERKTQKPKADVKKSDTKK